MWDTTLGKYVVMQEVWDIQSNRGSTLKKPAQAKKVAMANSDDWVVHEESKEAGDSSNSS